MRYGKLLFSAWLHPPVKKTKKKPPREGELQDSPTHCPAAKLQIWQGCKLAKGLGAPLKKEKQKSPFSRNPHGETRGHGESVRCPLFPLEALKKEATQRRFFVFCFLPYGLRFEGHMGPPWTTWIPCDKLLPRKCGAFL